MHDRTPTHTTCPPAHQPIRAPTHPPGPACRPAGSLTHSLERTPARLPARAPARAPARTLAASLPPFLPPLHARNGLKGSSTSSASDCQKRLRASFVVPRVTQLHHASLSNPVSKGLGVLGQMLKGILYMQGPRTHGILSDLGHVRIRTGTDYLSLSTDDVREGVGQRETQSLSLDHGLGCDWYPRCCIDCLRRLSRYCRAEM